MNYRNQISAPHAVMRAAHLEVALRDLDQNTKPYFTKESQ